MTELARCSWVVASSEIPGPFVAGAPEEGRAATERDEIDMTPRHGDPTLCGADHAHLGPAA